ncbi:MAG TPA: glycosyltransferase family 39 protein, partial [Coleofasciculaceae cyanobacterium]
LPPNPLSFLIIILLVLGIFFRFVNIERKFYWHDEVYSSLRISGFSQEEMTRQVFDGRVINVEDLQKYQYPNSEKNLSDSIFNSGIPEPQLPPLYFTLARFWVQIFGNSVAVTRSFSAVISLLVFPCIYWLCLELFNSPLTGWIAIALLAVSPFHVLYAQEARPYSLLTVLILLSGASLLRAMRLNTKGSWGIYTVAIALGFYSFLFFTFVTIAHGIYVLIIERFQVSKTLKAYLLASILGLIPFIPWIVFVIRFWRVAAYSTSGNWGPKDVSLLALVQTWIVNLSRIFIDFSFDYRDSLKNPLSYLFIILIGYSIYFLCSHTPPEIWLFVVSLMGVTGIAVILPDLIVRGILSGILRYAIPSVLGIQLAVAYLLATKIKSISIPPWNQRLWQIATTTVLALGVLSCCITSQSEYWWNKGADAKDSQMVRIINQSDKPLLIADKVNVLSLINRLKPQTKLQLIHSTTLPKISENFNSIFLYRPSQELKAGIEEKYNTKLILVMQHTQQTNPVQQFTSSLWKLEK